ncbi:MAG: ATP-binding protein [Oscillospiraceae bacterium]|nr:ATP-binding protein [Oscillospiraceae bacterium]
MKKQIFIRLFISAAISIMAFAAIVFFMFLAGRWNAETEIYIIVPIVVLLIALIAVALITSRMATGLTKKIVSSVEEIGLEDTSFSDYHELAPYAARLGRQKNEFMARLEELSSRTNAIETITESMQEGLILVDEKGIVLSANSSASELFGENLERRNIQHIYREPSLQKAVRKSLKGSNAEIQISRDSRVYTVFFSPVYSGQRSEVKGAVILFHDITEQHRAETQRREFSANVSHELKTPLTTISALSEMIAQGMARSEDIEGFAKKITEQSGRLLVLIDDIIRLSEFDEGATEKEFTIFNLRKLAVSVIDSLRDSADTIEFELIGGDFNISANRRMMDELLFNLIDNGIKYNTENGKVTVSLSQTNDGRNKISVADTGIGIAKLHHTRVFERFYRVDKSRSKKTGGTGLGLSIVKHITERHGGTLEIESTEDQGTTITCYIRR